MATVLKVRLLPETDRRTLPAQKRTDQGVEAFSRARRPSNHRKFHVGRTRGGRSILATNQVPSEVMGSQGRLSPRASVLFDFGGTLDADGIPWKERFFRLYQAEGLALSS